MKLNCLISTYMKFINIAIIIAVTAVSCTKQTVERRPASENSVTVNINTMLEDAAAVETKAGGVSPFRNSSIGIFVCDHFDGISGNPYHEHGYGMNNLEAQNSGSWSFKLSGMNLSYPLLVVTAKEDENENVVTADMFAYAPYNAGVTSPECIPFVIADTYRTDYLYAVENASSTVNKAIDPTAVDDMGQKIDTVNVNFTFRHALANLKINLRVKNPNYNHPDGDNPTDLTVTDILLTRQNGGHLYKGGKLNAITGELYDLQSTDRIHVDTACKLVPTQPSEDYQDDDYLFTFTIDGIEIKTDFKLKREQLRHYDSEGNPTDIYGFQAGYEYTLNFVYDNFVRLERVEIGKWVVDETPLYEIDI